MKLAENHPYEDLDYRHAAVLAKGGRILSRGWNSKKTHPHAPYRHGLRTIHAEVSALLFFNVLRRRPGRENDFRNYTMYVARLSASGPAISRPCEFCREVLQECGITRIMYTIEEAPFFREEYL